MKVTGWFVAVAVMVAYHEIGYAEAKEDASQTVVSRSKQFRVSGSEGVARGVAAIFAERSKDEFLSLLGEEDKWQVPVLIVLHGKIGDEAPARTFATRLWLMDGVWQLQLDKHVGPGLEPEQFRRKLTELLVIERSLVAQGTEAADLPLRVPVWLSVGLLEASAWRFKQADRSVYATLFRQGGMVGLDQLFDTTEDDYEKLDGATRAAFRVSAGSLVMALLEQPGGLQGFRNMLGNVAIYQGETPLLLREHFAALNLSENSLTKWWALQLANKGDLDPLTELMGVAETATLLEKALFLVVRGPDGARKRLELGEWKQLQKLELSERQAAVEPSQAALMHLSYRCFPSCRSLLVEYQKVLIRVAAGQTESVDAALRQLSEARQLMVARADRGRDYLDWFEITRARETSGAFDDYLKLKEELKDRSRNRKDELSGYLDRMDEVFDRSGD